MRALLALVAAVVTLLVGAGAASAQAVVIANVERVDGHTPSELQYFISRDDCRKKDQFTFPASVDYSQGERLELWTSEGVDCKLYDERQGSDASCTQIPLDIEEEKDVEILLTADQIANALPSVEECVDADGFSEGRPIALYFLLVTASGSDVPETNAFLWETTVDLSGPSPPGKITVGVGEEKLIAEFDIPESDEDRSGFVVFCDPNPTSTPGSGTGGAAGGEGGRGGGGSGGDAGGTGGAGGVGGAGGAAEGGGGGAGGAGGGTLAPDGGSGGTGGGGASDCFSSVFVPGEIPDEATLGLECGNGESGSVIGDDLVNGVRYAVAVVALDDLDNYGALSPIACGVPQPIDDFYKLYKEAGGEAGGGFCSASGGAGAARAAGGILGLACVALAGAFAWRRRQRRAR